jgi:hypothetical protein
MTKILFIECWKCWSWIWNEAKGDAIGRRLQYFSVIRFTHTTARHTKKSIVQPGYLPMNFYERKHERIEETKAQYY